MTPRPKQMRPTILDVQSQCKAANCRAEIVWKLNPNTGKYSPFNIDGSSHFATCPAAKIFRRKNER